jgi:hypothetical protein
MSESRQLKAIGPAGTQDVLALISTEAPWSLTVECADGTTSEATAQDLFAALESVRQELEEFGLLLCCQGSRPDVFPSGMARQSWGGRRAYRLRAGQKPNRDDLVDIFDPAACGEVVSVQRQYEAVERLRGR